MTVISFTTITKRESDIVYFLIEVHSNTYVLLVEKNANLNLIKSLNLTMNWKEIQGTC